MAAFSSSAMLSIFVRFHGSPSAPLLAMSCVFDSSSVSMIRRRLARSVEPVSVASTIASASTGGLTSVAPHENSTSTGTPRSLEVRAGDPHQFGGDRLASEVLGPLEGRVLRHGQHPADLAEALLGVDEVADGLENVLFRVTDLVLADPVLAR